MPDIKIPSPEAFALMTAEERQTFFETLGAVGEAPAVASPAPSYPKVATSWQLAEEARDRIASTVRAAADHFMERRSWRVRFSRRLRWWAILIDRRRAVPQTSLRPRQISKLPFFEGLAIAVIITDLVIREELVIWLNKKQPRAKRISVEIDA